MRGILSLLVMTLVLFLAGCGHKEFTGGKYDDLSEQRHLDDKFNETDMKEIATAMVQSLIESSVVKESKKKPVVLVTLTKNKTEEHIDMKSMTDKIRVALIKSGKFRFTEKEVREELQEELQYQGASGYVDPTQARQKGKQVGADYFLTGEITDRVQEVGDQKYVYYKCTMNLVGIQDGLIDWTDEKEIRKYYRKRSVGF